MSLAPFIAPIIVLGAIFIYGGGEFFIALQSSAQSGDASIVDGAAHPWVAYLLGFALVQWLLMAVFAVFGTLGVVLVSLIIAVVIVGFLTPVIVRVIRVKNYPNIEAAREHSLGQTLGNILKIFALFLVLLVCTLPFVFIPMLNFLFLQLPFFYLFYKLMLYDILSVGICADAAQIIEENRIYLFLVMLLFFFLSVIPFVGLLLQVFIVIYLSHFILSKSSNSYQKVTSIDFIED